MYATTLVDALKRILKGKGITYAMVAAGLGLSEASVKRMFSRRDFTLQRLEDVCRVAGVEFADLVEEASGGETGIVHLTVEQEEEIVSDPKLMLVALCAVGNWTFEQIVDTYAMSEAECIACLTRLDRRRIIELQPGNRIRPLISRTFSWRPDGPIQRYFRERVETEYLSCKFDRPDELFLFVSGMLSQRSTADVITRRTAACRCASGMARASSSQSGRGNRARSACCAATIASRSRRAACWSRRPARPLHRAGRGRGSTRHHRR